MVKIDEKTKREYYDYLEKHRRMEMIDSAILENMGRVFGYYDNEVDLYARDSGGKRAHSFETDLVYMSSDLKSIVFVEETIDPTTPKKVKQLVDYCNITAESLRMLTGADKIPIYDVFLVFPEKHGHDALSIYKQNKDKMKIPNRDYGISLWDYPESRTHLRCIEGTFSPGVSGPFPSLTQMKTKRIGAFRILKSAHHIFLLQFIVMRALESEYGATTDGIRFDKTKLLEWLRPYGIVKEERWREAIRVGSNVGWLEDVSIDQLTGRINYTKLSPTSISRSKKLTSDFFVAVEEEEDRTQKDLGEFGLRMKNVAEPETDEELESDDETGKD